MLRNLGTVTGGVFCIFFFFSSSFFLCGVFAEPVAVDSGASVREYNGGNCIGTQSCRPRCLSWRVIRDSVDCSTTFGAFAALNPGPWSVGSFHSNCHASTALPANLRIRVGEEGHTGPTYFTDVLLMEGEDVFTFCSIYPCPKDECALPEQMGSSLRFAFFDSEDATSVQKDDHGTAHGDQRRAVLTLKIVLTSDFVGDPILSTEPTRFGPLQLEWLDDPTGCRRGLLSLDPPVLPPCNPIVHFDGDEVPQEQFCEGPQYAPAPLAKATSVQGSPSPPPMLLSQTHALWSLFVSTGMASSDSRPKHNWFGTVDGEATHYCYFTGVICDDEGYVTSLELANKRLANSLPEAIGDLQRLSHLNLRNNEIGGHIPMAVGNLRNLTLVDVSRNKLDGAILPQLANIPVLRRLDLSFNHLTGTIPSSLCRLNETLAVFDISVNKEMSGTIPTCFGEMSLLRVLLVRNVPLVGTLPQDLCGLRKMNGLDPNTFGCDAIACPAGTFQSADGRQTDATTRCQECPFPSNVIGSTRCIPFDDTLEPSMTPSDFDGTIMSPSDSLSIAPTKRASKSPTIPQLIPTSPPTYQPPTEDPTHLQTAAPSQTPRAMPTEPPSHQPTTGYPSPEALRNPTREPARIESTLPTQNWRAEQNSYSPSQGIVTAIPTSVPTRDPNEKAPSIPAQHTLNLTATFSNVVNSVLNTTQIASFETATLNFLAALAIPSVVVSGVQMRSQFLVPLPEANQTVTFAANNVFGPRALQGKVPGADFVLAVAFSVAGTYQGNSSFQGAILDAFMNHPEEYTKALGEMVQLSREGFGGQPEGIARSPEDSDFLAGGQQTAAISLFVAAALLISGSASALCLYDRRTGEIRRHFQKGGSVGLDKKSSESDTLPRDGDDDGYFQDDSKSEHNVLGARPFLYGSKSVCLDLVPVEDVGQWSEIDLEGNTESHWKRAQEDLDEASDGPPRAPPRLLSLGSLVSRILARLGLEGTYQTLSDPAASPSPSDKGSDGSNEESDQGSLSPLPSRKKSIGNEKGETILVTRAPSPESPNTRKQAAVANDNSSSPLFESHSVESSSPNSSMAVVGRNSPVEDYYQGMEEEEESRYDSIKSDSSAVTRRRSGRGGSRSWRRRAGEGEVQKKVTWALPTLATSDALTARQPVDLDDDSALEEEGKKALEDAKNAQKFTDFILTDLAKDFERARSKEPTTVSPLGTFAAATSSPVSRAPLVSQDQLSPVWPATSASPRAISPVPAMTPPPTMVSPPISMSPPLELTRQATLPSTLSMPKDSSPSPSLEGKKTQELTWLEPLSPTMGGPAHELIQRAMVHSAERRRKLAALRRRRSTGNIVLDSPRVATPPPYSPSQDGASEVPSFCVGSSDNLTEKMLRSRKVLATADTRGRLERLDRTLKDDADAA